MKDRGEIIGEEPVSVLGPVNLIRETGRGEEEEEMVTVESVEIENQVREMRSFPFSLFYRNYWRNFILIPMLT